MNISLQIIMDKLSVSCFRYSSLSDFPINCVYNAAIYKDSANFDSDTLYIFKCSWINKLSLCNEPLPLNMLLIRDIITVPIPENNSLYNILIIQENVDLEELYFELQNIINSYNKWSTDLLLSVTKGKGFQSLMDIAFEFFHNPIMLLDNSLKVLACSKTEEFNEKAWLESNIDGFVSFYDTKAEDGLKRYLRELNIHKEPFVFDSNHLEHKFLILICFRKHRNYPIPSCYRFNSIFIVHQMQKSFA